MLNIVGIYTLAILLSILGFLLKVPHSSFNEVLLGVAIAWFSVNKKDS